MTQPQSVFIIIPVHNRKSTTLSCLETLRQNGDLERYHTIIFDDGSTDGTGAAIAERYPEVILLNGDGNFWWTGAIGQSMDYARHENAGFIIWLNDDCIPYPGTLSLLVDFCQNHPSAIAGAACYLSGSSQPHASGAQGRKRVAAKPGEMIPVDEMSGHCVCFPASVMTQVGVPDSNRFPHYHGDSMYILKATRSGFKAYILGNARIDHAGTIKSRLYDFIDPSQKKYWTIQNFKALFFSRKSFYYIPTQFFYYLEKYGVWVGLPMFLVKTVVWLGKWVQFGLSKPARDQRGADSEDELNVG